MRAKTKRQLEAHQDICFHELTLLSTAKQRAIILQVEININQLRTRQQLHDHARSDNRGDTELHERASVGSHDGSEPVERVGRVRRHDTVKGDLRADQENQECGGCPGDFGVEGDLKVSMGVCKRGIQ